MASVQTKKEQFTSRAIQKIADIGYSMVEQRSYQESVFDDSYYIDELTSGIDIVNSTYCCLTDNEYQSIIDYLECKYELSDIPVNLDIVLPETVTILKDGQSIVGPAGNDGTDGKSAYEIAVDNGFVGTESEWLTSLEGNAGATGNNGWTPNLVVVADGATREVLKVESWTGGGGTPPTSGVYVGSTGFVGDIADAVNIKGSNGADGADGANGIGTDGDNGWSPVFAVETDSQDPPLEDRKVLRLVQYTGGTGTPPTITNSYIGASGLVADIADAVDIRGPEGPTGEIGPQGIKGDSPSLSENVRVATTANLVATYSALILQQDTPDGLGLTIDAVALEVGDRVLVKDQTTQTDNGIYVVTSLGSGVTPWQLTRSADFDGTSDLRKYAQSFVEEGATNAQKNYTIFTDRDTLTLDSSNIVFGEQDHPLQHTDSQNGDVQGPISSTDNALVAFDGLTGKLIKETTTIFDSGTGELKTPSGLVSSNNPNTKISWLTKAIAFISESIEILRVDNDAEVGVIINNDNEVIDFVIKSPNNDYAVNFNGTNESLGIFTASPNASTSLDIDGSKAVRFPRLTTTQRDALTPSNGMMIYNTSTANFQFYANGSWVEYNVGAGAARASTTLNSWTLVSGDIYSATFNHALNNTDVVVYIKDSVSGFKVQVEDIEIVDANNVRIYVQGNSETLRVTVI